MDFTRSVSLSFPGSFKNILYKVSTCTVRNRTSCKYFYHVLGYVLSYNDIKGEGIIFLKKYILWMKTIHYPNTLRSHWVPVVPMAPFTPKSTSKLRSALHFSYSIVIRRFYSHANTAQS